MSKMNRRRFLKTAGLGAAGAATATPFVFANNHGDTKVAGPAAPADFYKKPMKGNVRFIHMTDAHGQLHPTYFREPNVNLGVGEALNRPPHLVGTKLLEKAGLPTDPSGIHAYAYTYLNFDENSKKYGRTGGHAHIKTLVDMLRKEAGGKENTVMMDGGDTWQGSGSSLWTRGVDMVEAANILGVDVMVGHWEFTYPEAEVLANVALFKGDFVGQNVRVKEDALFGDEYAEMTQKFDGLGLYDEDSGHAFKPYAMREINGNRIAVIGQAFPRTANANPPENFPDWSFGLREGDMRDLVKKIRTEEKAAAVVLVSHNGADVDMKMAKNVGGLDAVFGGHTHDGMPQPVEIKDVDGGTCLITNAGCSGKYIGVMDFDIKEGKVVSRDYKMMPVFEKLLPADPEMQAYLDQLGKRKYDDKVKESRNPKFAVNKSRVGKTYDEINSEKLAIADRTLYRRGNFMGTFDQVLCDALRDEYKADISLSAGVRWGTTVPKGEWITMSELLSQTSMTYGETYVTKMSGEAIHRMLEQVADNLLDPDPYLQSGGDMVRVGGLDYTIDPTKKLFERITEVKLDNGESLNPKKEYSVAGWATVDRTPEGRLMWDVVRDYILRAKDKKTNILNIKKMNQPKLVNVESNPGFAPYDKDSL